MGIPERVIEEVRGRVKLSEIIGQDIELRRSGSTFKACCPFHNEKTPSFIVDDNKAFYKCYGCGVSGDVFSWMQERRNMDFVQAAIELGRIAHVDVEGQMEESSATPEEKAARKKEREDTRSRKAWMLRANEVARDWFVSCLWQGGTEAQSDKGTKFKGEAEQSSDTGGGACAPQEQSAGSSTGTFGDDVSAEAARALDYIRGRGFSDETIREWGLGYAPAGGGLADHLIQLGKGAGRKPETMRKCAVAAGLLGKSESGFIYERFKGRLMFPIADAQGRVVGFSGRVLPGGEMQNGRKVGKYVNTSETDIFKKHSLLYGLDKAVAAIRQRGHATLTEGNTDVIKAHQSGKKHYVATLGTAFTEEHARVLSGFCNVLLAGFDNDEAGQKAARKTRAVCNAAGIELRVFRYQKILEKEEVAA